MFLRGTAAGEFDATAVLWHLNFSPNELPNQKQGTVGDGETCGWESIRYA